MNFSGLPVRGSKLRISDALSHDLVDPMSASGQTRAWARAIVRSALPPITAVTDRRINVRFVPILLQKSQKAPRLIFRQRTKQATIADQCSLKPVIGVVRKFGARRRGSPTLLFDRRAYGSENLSPMPQKYFCNKIGTKRTFIQAIIDVCYRGYSGPHGCARRGPSLTP